MDKLLFFALAIGSGWLTWSLWNEHQTYSDLENWPRVTASVTTLDSFEEEWETKYGIKYKKYLMKLEYRYEVDGQIYSGDNKTASGDELVWSTPESLLAAQDKYLLGDANLVQVAYHLEDPGTSVAIVGEPSLDDEPAFSWISILMCGGFFVFMALSFVGYWLEPNHQQLEENYIQSLRSDV